MLTAQGSVVLTHFDHGFARVEVAASREAMVVRLFEKSLVAEWGSDRHIEALKRIRVKLDETIAEIDKSRDDDDAMVDVSTDPFAEHARTVANTVLEEAEDP